MKKTTKERFLANVNKTNTCWLWTGYTINTGYGSMRVNSKPTLAHRLSYSLFRGDLDPSILVLHKCDNRRCVNPKHLFLGTHLDNALDREKKGRGNQRKGEEARSTKLTKKQVEEIIKKYVPGKNSVDRGYSMYRLAKEYGVSQMSIWGIIHKTTWRG